MLLGLCLIAYIVYAGLSVWAARQWHRVRRPIDPDWMPSVTILKPVSGFDAYAYDNFASFCRLDYPCDRLQLIFGVLDPHDPALSLVRQLQQDFPEHDICIVAPPEIQAPRGHNLKVCNLLSMLPAAKHDVLVLCDSDMRVMPDYLRKVVAPFQRNTSSQNSDMLNSARRNSVQQSLTRANNPPAIGPMPALPNIPVGLVTCPYRGFLPESLPAKLEALGIGADFIPSTLVSRAVEGVGFAFGSTIAIPRHVLDEIGGFEAILDELADDFRLGNSVKQAGYEVVLSNYVVDDVLGQERFGPMWARRLRWARTVQACRPVGYTGAFITYGTALSLLFWAAMGCSALGWLVLMGVTLWRIGVSIYIGSAYTRDANVRLYWYLLPLSDLLGSALYIASFFGRHITWRGHRFRLYAGGRIERLA